MRGRAAASAAALAIGLVPGPASAHTLNPPPTRVLTLSAATSGATVNVSGKASFGGQKLLRVATDPAGDQDPPFPAALGYDLIEAKVGQLEASNGDFTFVFRLVDLPITGALPEVALYTWDFTVSPVDRPLVFHIEGGFSRLLNGETRRPAFDLLTCVESAGAFDCTDSSPLVAELIPSDNEIFVDIPKSLLEQKAGRSLERTQLVPHTSVDWNDITSEVSGPLARQEADSITPVGDYTVAFKVVRLGIAPYGQTPQAMQEATLNADGTFGGSIDISGLSPGFYDVVAEACFGTNCGQKKMTLNI